MRIRQLHFIFLICIVFFSCDGLAELVHGPKPEEPLVTYTVAFHASGAVGTPPETLTVETGKSIILPDKGDLSSPENIFLGWTENPHGTGAVYPAGDSILITNNMDFYAKWTESSAISFLVSFDTNGATSGFGPPAQVVIADDTIILPGGDGFFKSDYIFDGWNTNSSGTGINYEAGASYRVTGDVTLYAKWNIVTTYTVTYNINGGSGTVPDSQSAQAGSSITLSSGSELTKSDYTFDGWNTNDSGTGINYEAGGSYTITGNVTLYAKWDVINANNYTVTYDINDGSGIAPASQTVQEGSSITLPSGSGLTKSGYTFDGWNTNDLGTGINYEASSSYTVTDNVTLYAKWDIISVNNYTVTYNTNGGTGTAPTPQTVQEGSSITLPSGSGLSKSGYTFGGWNTNDSGTGTNYEAGDFYTVTDNVTLYTKWDIASGSGPGDNISNFSPGLYRGNVKIGEQNLSAALHYISANAVSGDDHYIILEANETISPTTLGYSGKAVGITLVGFSTEKTITLASNGSMFTINNEVSLTLDRNITLVGRSSNNASLVTVNNNAMLIMNDGSKVTGNNYSFTSSYGGGIRVNSNGTLIMNGGVVSGNSAGNGGGVLLVGNYSIFLMNGGIISGNTAGWGGGVHLDVTYAEPSNTRIFTMNGGVISENTANFGGGVFVGNYSIFLINGGIISGNTAAIDGLDVRSLGTILQAED